MISAMEYLLEAENCVTAAQAATDPDERAEYVRRAACYRNLAVELMPHPAGGAASYHHLQAADTSASRVAQS